MKSIFQNPYHRLTRLRFSVAVLLTCALVISSCGKDDNNDSSNTQGTDEYYVRYEVESTYIGTTRDMIVTIKNDKANTLTFNLRTSLDWDMTIGPVSKDFAAEITCNASPYTANMHPKIFVSKNNNPFALKANREYSGQSVTLNYNIDY